MSDSDSLSLSNPIPQTPNRARLPVGSPSITRECMYTAVQLQKFLQKNDIHQTSLVLDGPGAGCVTQTTLVSLLGLERLLRFPRVNIFSASSFALFFYVASQKNLLKNRKTYVGWNKENQERHGISKKYFSFLRVLRRRLLQGSFFQGESLERALLDTVDPQFARLPMSEMPKNFRVWAFDLNRNEFVSIDAQSKLKKMTLNQVVRAAASIPGIYQPFEYEDYKLIDAISGPKLQELYNTLRNESENCLFSTLSRYPEHQTTTYLKLQRWGSGYLRPRLDMLYFMLGLENIPFDQGLNGTERASAHKTQFAQEQLTQSKVWRLHPTWMGEH